LTGILKSHGNVLKYMLSDKDIHKHFIGSDKSLLLLFSKYMDHLLLQKLNTQIENQKNNQLAQP
jgi:hypothetical protein